MVDIEASKPASSVTFHFAEFQFAEFQLPVGTGLGIWLRSGLGSGSRIGLWIAIGLRLEVGDLKFGELKFGKMNRNRVFNENAIRWPGWKTVTV